MENGTVTTLEGAAGSVDHLVSASPCALLGLWYHTPGTDISVFSYVITLFDEAATADIDANSKILYRTTISDPAANPNLSFSIQSGKGLCVRFAADGTNTSLLGINWR